LIPAARAQPAATLLIVDDDDFGRETLGRILEAAGYTVLRAASGGEALRWLRHGPRPDLIVLDLLMPSVDGWRVFRQQQRDPCLARIPVVVVSAADAALLPRPGHGIVGRFTKPVNVHDLLDTIRRHCKTGGPSGG
jgi:CheY-like chemotaxis protein